MMLGAAAYILMMQMSRSAAENFASPQMASPGVELAVFDWQNEDWLSISAKAFEVRPVMADRQSDPYERSFGGPGSNMRIYSFDPAMFPILTIPGTNCSNMPIYVWRPDQPQEPPAQPIDTSTFVPLRSVGP